MVDKTEVVGYSGTVFETVLAATQTNEILQAVQIILSIIAFIVTISYTIWKWYKKATDDDSDGGKNITKNEVNDLFEDLKDIKEDKKDGNKD